MSDNQGVVRRIAWREICPWLLIVRAFGVATDLPVITLATLGILLTPIGWWASDTVFLGESMREYVPGLAEDATRNRSPYERLQFSGEEFTAVERWIPWNSSGVARGIFTDFAGPFLSAMDWRAVPDPVEGIERPAAPGIRRTAYYLFGGLWMIALWSLAGGAITRIATLRLAQDIRVTLRESIRYALRHYLAYLVAPLMPLSLVLLFVLFMMVPGWILLAGGGGVFVVSLGWGILLLFAFIVALIIFVLFFAWPLMVPAVSADSSDSFDAVARAYSFTYQRPLNYVFYAAVALLMLALGGLLADVFSKLVVETAHWGASWGAGSARMNEVLADPEGREEVGWGMKAGYNVIKFWEGLVVTVATGFLYGLFWCLASAVYLLLRRDVDETEFDDVVTDDDIEHDLPPLEPPPTKTEIESQPEPSSDNGDSNGEEAKPEDNN